MSYSRAFGYSSGGGSSVVQLNPNIVPDTDADGNLISSSVTTTQLGYLNGVNAPIQTQLNTITGEITTLNSEVSTINGEITSINTSLAGKQATISLNDNIVPVTNSSGALTSSTVTSTTLGYLDATSSIQGQLNTIDGEITSINTSLAGKQATISLNNNIVPVTNGSGALTSSSVSSTTLGYLDATSSIQTQLNGKQSTISGLTSGKHLVATGSSTIANSSILSESGSNLTAAGNFLPSNTNTNNLGNSNYTWGGVAANNIVAENGTVYNYCQSLTLGLINSNYGIYTTMTAGTANYYFCFGEGSGWFTNASILPSSDGYSALGASGQRWSSLYVDNIIGSGTILYNTANSSAGTGYSTMDSVFTYEYTVTAANVLNNTSYTFPFPSGKSASNIRKLEAVMYDGTSTVPQNYTVNNSYAFSLGCNGSGLFFQTAPSWSRTGLTITFYGWITTN